MATSISHNPAETEALGETWGRSAQYGLVIALCGELGAGKTQLVKGLARGLDIPARVHSPSFTLLNIYPGGRFTLFHLDLFRLETREQISAAGLEEYFQPDGVTVIEWADRWFGSCKIPSAEHPHHQPNTLAATPPAVPTSPLGLGEQALPAKAQGAGWHGRRSSSQGVRLVVWVFGGRNFAGSKPAIRPFNDRHSIRLEVFFESRGANLFASFETKQIEMKQGEAPARIDVEQCEARRVHPRRDIEPARQALDQLRLASAELAAKRDHQPILSRTTPGFAKSLRFS